MPPAVPLTLEATLVTCRSALATTLRTAVTELVLVPTEVVREPAGIVLVNVPEAELVTTTLKEQLAPGGICVPDDSVTLVPPGVLPAVPIQLVTAVEVLIRPVGKTSLNCDDSVAVARACALVIVIVNSVVPPALMLLLAKLLAMVGLDGVTVSTSPAEHTPAPVHEADTLVLVTVAGGVIVATLLTCVCAWETAK